MKTLFSVFIVLVFNEALSQDTIYLRKGKILEGKVEEVSAREIRYKLKQNETGPVYILSRSDVDSIVYSNGYTDNIFASIKQQRKENIKYKNTYGFDSFGFITFSISQWYERRVWNDRIGIRVPVYLSFYANGASGNLVVWDGAGKLGGGSFGFATGINPKFYLNKHRYVRAFIGPELTLGYSSMGHRELATPVSGYYPKYFDKGYYVINYDRIVGMGNFASSGILGICINMHDRFNFTFEGGLGYNVWWGKMQNKDHLITRVGFSFGVNF